MGLEWHLLRADDHLCRYSKFLKKACGRSGSLQAEDLLPIPNASHVDGIADAFNGFGTRRLFSQWIVPYLLVERRKAPAREVEVEIDQLPIRVEYKK